MIVNFLYDALNSFGNRSSAGTFPNTIAFSDITAERMTVDLKTPDGHITSDPMGSVTLAIDGSNEENGTYGTIVLGIPLSDSVLNRDGYSLPIPKNKYRYLRARVTGTFSGTIQAIINSYIGK